MSDSPAPPNKWGDPPTPCGDGVGCVIAYGFLFVGAAATCLLAQFINGH